MKKASFKNEVDFAIKSIFTISMKITKIDSNHFIWTESAEYKTKQQLCWKKNEKMFNHLVNFRICFIFIDLDRNKNKNKYSFFRSNSWREGGGQFILTN